MTEKQQLTGIILAGGKSSRMGFDKGLIRWQGKTFTEYIIDTLRQVTNDVFIVSNNPSYEKFGLEVYPDVVENKGPLGGIYTGLFRSVTSGNLVVGCDTPFVHANFLKVILSASGGFDVCVTANGDRLEPLIGYYSKQCLETFSGLLQNGDLKMHAAIECVKHNIISMDRSVASSQVMNINTRADLRSII